MPAWLIVVLISILCVGLFVAGLSLTLIIKGHHIDSEISTNKNMQRLGIKCAVQKPAKRWPTAIARPRAARATVQAATSTAKRQRTRRTKQTRHPRPSDRTPEAFSLRGRRILRFRTDAIRRLRKIPSALRHGAAATSKDARRRKPEPAAPAGTVVSRRPEIPTDTGAEPHDHRGRECVSAGFERRPYPRQSAQYFERQTNHGLCRSSLL